MSENVDTIQTVEINPEFKDLLPILTPDEYQSLEESILREGCRDAIVLWGSIIVDGHNRYEICTKHNIEFKTIQMDFENADYASEWIILNALSRRNLSTAQRVALVYRHKEILAKTRKENQKLSKGKGIKGSKKDDEEKGPQKSGDLKGSTVKILAKLAGVSHDTIEKYQKIEEKASDNIKEQLASGEMSINKAYKAINVHVGQNTGEFEWYTPKKYINAAVLTMGSIDLDPASSEAANQTVEATEFFDEQTNGLDKPWHGNVWMNPPYSQPLIANFSDKLVQELPNINQACVIVNNATETKWFQHLLNSCQAVCFVKGRVKFIDATGKKGAPLQGQFILYYGSNIDEFKFNFKQFGICTTMMR